MDNCKWCGCDTFFGGFHTSISYPDDKRCKNVGLCNEYLIKQLKEENKDLKEYVDSLEQTSRNLQYFRNKRIKELEEELAVYKFRHQRNDNSIESNGIEKCIMDDCRKRMKKKLFCKNGHNVYDGESKCSYCGEEASTNHTIL